MVEEKIKKIIEENNISDNSEIKPISLAGMFDIIMNILQKYSEAIAHNLNEQTKILKEDTSEEEVAMINAMTTLFNEMFNKAISPSIDYIVENLPSLLGIDGEIDDMEECDGEA